MNKNLKIAIKILIIVLYFTLAFGLLMMRLPRFVSDDKLAHSLFYFITAMFLTVLCDIKTARGHFLIFVLLFFFGVGIELLQEYSNTYFHKKLHGKFDFKDVIANIKGLLAFSIMWFTYSFIDIFRLKYSKK